MNLEKEINEDALKMAWANLQERIRKIKQGGGKSRLKKLSEQGKLSALTMDVFFIVKYLN